MKHTVNWIISLVVCVFVQSRYRMHIKGITRKSAIIAGVALLCGLSTSLSAQSDPKDYPNKPIRVIVPNTPGGPPDMTMRMLSPKLSASLGQPIVIDNRAGACGIIGTVAVAKSPPDGYTWLFATASHNNNPAFNKNANYDPVHDFTPVTMAACNFGQVLIVHPSVPANSVSELVALAKAKPGALNYASAGIGSPLHLAAELFKSHARISMVHVAYKGGGPAATAVLAGETQVVFGSVAASLQHVRTGRLKALAVTGLKRSYLAPELPTLDESGFPGFNVTAWHSFVAPAGTPREIVARLHDEAVRVLHLPEIVKLVNNIGYEPTGTTPEQLAAIIRNESAVWAKVIRDANIRAE